jgi:Superfamily II DNA and RNA helicases
MDSSGNAGWSDFKLNKQLFQAIDESGFTEPTEIQRKCIPLVLGGQQVIGIAQTGTGKTAAYLLPILMKLKFKQGNDPRAVIFVPTKELVVQVEAQATALSKHTDLRIVAIYGGVGPKTQIEKLNEGCDLLIATPGRFTELYSRTELIVKQIKMLVLDEADKMMDMGFMPQLRRIFEVIPQKRQNLLFSATYPEKVERLGNEFLEFPIRVEVTPQATVAKKVKQELYFIPNIRTKISFLEHLLGDQEKFNRVMIFARTKESADQVFKFIDRKNLGPCKVVHSNKGQNTRINAMNEFKEGKLRVLVSTDVASRGIDVVNVSHVINFDVPIVYEDYVHRIGRTGRAFQSGIAITLATRAEEYHITEIEKIIREKIPVKKLPTSIVIEETSSEEAQQMAREVDRQKRRLDPEFKGAFHEKRR